MMRLVAESKTALLNRSAEHFQHLLIQACRVSRSPKGVFHSGCSLVQLANLLMCGEVQMED